MPPTSLDVARRAGVSQSTVSLVLSGKAAGRVSATTVAVVQAAAAELGYRPNEAARALRTGRARAIGLVVPDVTNPFFGRLLRGAQLAARRHGYTVALVDAASDAEAERVAVRALRSSAVDGYLTFEMDPSKEFPGWNEPTVAIEAWNADVPTVRLDVEHGARATLEHLAGLGHRRVGLLWFARPVDTFEARRAVMEDLAPRLGIELPFPRVDAIFDIEQAGHAARELLERPDRPTAVVCADDVQAAGVYLAARELGLRIPADLSVVGFDDMDYARVLTPPLTTVRVDGEELGAAALELLVDLMAGAGGEAREETVQGVELVVRASTAPPA